ncbi:MAG TPA: hypothetical protein VHF07_00945 [Nitrospiraceae bacterium]|nr:hypothetical protein [Nitrospiraceae bacterium]
MRSALFHASVHLLLAAVVLMVGGTMSASVAHDLQHAAHHTAASHSKGICAWMCATGGVAQPAWPAPLHALYETEGIAPVPDRHPPIGVLLDLNSRAPPLIFA